MSAKLPPEKRDRLRLEDHLRRSTFAKQDRNRMFGNIRVEVPATICCRWSLLLVTNLSPQALKSMPCCPPPGSVESDHPRLSITKSRPLKPYRPCNPLPVNAPPLLLVERCHRLSSPHRRNWPCLARWSDSIPPNVLPIERLPVESRESCSTLEGGPR